MVARITIDSSVIIAALLEHETKHKECKRLFEKVKNEIGLSGLEFEKSPGIFDQPKIRLNEAFEK